LRVAALISRLAALVALVAIAALDPGPETVGALAAAVVAVAGEGAFRRRRPRDASRPAGEARRVRPLGRRDPSRRDRGRLDDG